VPVDTFDQLRAISRLTRQAARDDEARDMLVRFLDTYPGNTPEQPIVDALCARFGLFPYVSEGNPSLGTWEALALELHTPPELREEGFTFHAQQSHVYRRLMDGESVILSAPTSFGKSVIIDALIASEKWSNVVLIVPTIALIDETRRRLARFRSTYTIVTHPAEVLGSRNVVVMTQERFLELDVLPDVDLFMIDEFYKLGSGPKKDARRTLLNLAWTRLRDTGAQYYLIGPNIDALDERVPEDMREKLYRTEFKTVAVDVYDRSSVADQRSDLLELVKHELTGSTLVFTGSPQKAEDLGVLLASDQHSPGLSTQVAEWVAENYDQEWDVVSALRGGVGIHTGPLPRGLQRIMVRLFNEAAIPTLVCTSTLIEGVNTAAKNVVIFEKKIDGQLIDFFTFSNIRGRAGRMFRHYVGKVFTYMPPPESDLTVVDIPIDTQSDEDLDDVARARLDPVLDQQTLSLETIRRNKGLDPVTQVATARAMKKLPRGVGELLSWTGKPSTPQMKTTLQFAFENLLESHQRTGMNFNILWGKLQNARFNAEDFQEQVARQMTYKRPNQTRSDIVTEVFRFQRNWMGFTIPSMLRGLQAIQGEILSSQFGAANYELLLREIENLYLPTGLVELEDYGMPLPLSTKLVRLGLRGGEIAELLERVVRLANDPKVVSSLSVVEQWVLEDVVVGITGPINQRR
jgi:hypothetical protein